MSTEAVQASAGRREQYHLLILTLLTIFALGPMVVLSFNSLKSRAEIGRAAIGLPP